MRFLESARSRRNCAAWTSLLHILHSKHQTLFIGMADYLLVDASTEQCLDISVFQSFVLMGILISSSVRKSSSASLVCPSASDDLGHGSLQYDTSSLNQLSMPPESRRRLRARYRPCCWIFTSLFQPSTPESLSLKRDLSFLKPE